MLIKLIFLDHAPEETKIAHAQLLGQQYRP